MFQRILPSTDKKHFAKLKISISFTSQYGNDAVLKLLKK